MVDLLAIKRVFNPPFLPYTTQVTFGFDQNFGQNGGPPGVSNPQRVGEPHFFGATVGTGLGGWHKVFFLKIYGINEVKAIIDHHFLGCLHFTRAAEFFFLEFQ